MFFTSKLKSLGHKLSLWSVLDDEYLDLVCKCAICNVEFAVTKSSLYQLERVKNNLLMTTVITNRYESPDKVDDYFYCDRLKIFV